MHPDADARGQAKTQVVALAAQRREHARRSARRPWSPAAARSRPRRRRSAAPVRTCSTSRTLASASARSASSAASEPGRSGTRTPELQVAPGRGHAVPDDPQQQQRVDVAAGQHRDHRRPRRRAPAGSSSAATRGRAGRLDDQLGPLEQEQQGARQALLADRRRSSSTSSRTSANGTSPGRPTAMPSAIVVIALERARARRRPATAGRPRPSSAWTPTTRRPGAAPCTAVAMPASSPPPPALTRTVRTSGHCSRISRPHGALPGDDVGVVERVDEDRAGLGRELAGRDQAVVDVVPDELDLRAVRRVADELGQRRARAA